MPQNLIQKYNLAQCKLHTGGLHVLKSVLVEVISPYVGISECRAGSEKSGMCIYGGGHTLSKRNKALFCLLGNTASIVFTKQSGVHTFKHPWTGRQQNSLCLTKSRLEVKIYKFSKFSGQITPKLQSSLTIT